MKPYIPEYVGTVTKYVFVDSPDTTPQDIATAAYEVAQGVMIKETCFGCQITGTPEDVGRIVDHLRKLDPYRIFVKDRGFPPGDARRCRADLGGARPGYLGHEFEMKMAPYISFGLEAVDKMTAEELEIAAGEQLPVEEPLDADILEQLMEE
ncbi:MAG TPA: methanogenesis marker 6 protein [Methanocorpusculum sp.]|jgi:putative methanogenesis marker protein 6|nr:methanogenesis marker 6 protein [Methanocorpusculum sp.]MBR5814647.1 methanogenesis marker 6 protein [Methanocorpusculaceae archaeon]MBR4284473.1 methanogenesis marker 6 protein [Methanocorpusculum sp.]MBR5008446.1 methanogenesis marker 6 protein [Methanocorpusculum sp.]MBR5142849.1 methanogenesis marker 6 protein [Methanocorpusculum sp.]